MTRIVISGILFGLIEHRKIYERSRPGGPYDLLISHNVRYFWKWWVTKEVNG